MANRFQSSPMVLVQSEEEINLFEWFQGLEDANRQVLIRQSQAPKESAFVNMAKLMLKNKNYDSDQLPVLRTFAQSLTKVASSPSGRAGRSSTKASKSSSTLRRTSGKGKRDKNAKRASEHVRSMRRSRTVANAVEAGAGSKGGKKTRISITPTKKGSKSKSPKSSKSPKGSKSAVSRTSKRRNTASVSVQFVEDERLSNWKPPEWIDFKDNTTSFLEEKMAYRGDLMMHEAQFRKDDRVEHAERTPQPRMPYQGQRRTMANTLGVKRPRRTRSKSTADEVDIEKFRQREKLAMVYDYDPDGHGSYGPDADGQLGRNAYGNPDGHLGAYGDPDGHGYADGQLGGPGDGKDGLNGAGGDDDAKNGGAGDGDDDLTGKDGAGGGAGGDGDGAGGDGRDGRDGRDGEGEDGKDGSGAGDGADGADGADGDGRGDLKPGMVDTSSWVKKRSMAEEKLAAQKEEKRSSRGPGRLDMDKFRHLTKISLTLTNSARIVLEDKKDLDLKYRRSKKQSQLKLQQARTLPPVLSQPEDELVSDEDDDEIDEY